MYSSLRYIIALVALMWSIKFIELATHSDFHHLGILPRSFTGMFGIITAPLIHGDFIHLLSNSLPLLVLGAIIFLMYRAVALDAVVSIYILSGILVWIFGRPAYHIGASGLVYGMFGFIFFVGLFLKQQKPMIVSAAIFFLYGGIFYGLFPHKIGVSWESHLFGMASGALFAWYIKQKLVKVMTLKVEKPNPFTLSDPSLYGIIQYRYIVQDKDTEDEMKFEDDDKPTELEK